jgi:ComF family protein
LERVETPCCAVCGESFGGAADGAFRCSNCEGRRLAFEFATAAYHAKGPLREIIHRFKYARDVTMRAPLAESLRLALDEPRLAGESLEQWLLVPVPLYWTRQIWRGYNQSWELCRELSKSTGIPAVRVLRRRWHTGTQARLARSERLENLRGVFSLRRVLPLPGRWRPEVRGKSVLLVDDVLTTGATAHECAKVLRREAGAARVVVITAARG